MAKKCEGAPWCLWQVADNVHACPMHTKYPTLHREEREAWATRVRRTEAARIRAAKKQAESDQKLARR